MNKCIFITIMMALVSSSVTADRVGDRVESESRDASAAFVATQHFVVGRIGRDCLGELGRSETPLGYLEKWQRENGKYYDAATEYIAARLNEIDDPREREAVERAYYASAQHKGEAATNQLFSNGPKNEICKSAITLIDSGRMNIEEYGKAIKQPIMQDLAELVEWAKAH